jgi:hypothetical protein
MRALQDHASPGFGQISVPVLPEKCLAPALADTCMIGKMAISVRLTELRYISWVMTARGVSTWLTQINLAGAAPARLICCRPAEVV